MVPDCQKIQVQALATTRRSDHSVHREGPQLQPSLTSALCLGSCSARAFKAGPHSLPWSLGGWLSPPGPGLHLHTRRAKRAHPTTDWTTVCDLIGVPHCQALICGNLVSSQLARSTTPKSFDCTRNTMRIPAATCGLGSPSDQHLARARQHQGPKSCC